MRSTATAQESQQHAKALECFGDWRWRLNNLYWITDKVGRRVKFEMNWAQEALFDEMHYMNVILKARQLGFTTFIQTFMLDACVFNSNVRAGTIAHNLTDAQKIFRDKVKFPYDNLPEGIRATRHPIRDSSSELALSNNSSLSVGTSHRGGTLQYLHISELGKIASKYPEKAREIRTGALNTIQAGQVAFIESTAEGQEGDFWRICEESQASKRMGLKLTELDFKFHFFPWWRAPEYTIDPNGVVIPVEFQKYFDQLKTAHDIDLTPGQKAWYVKKASTQLGDMKREYPSIPKEAFEASVEGAYYGVLMEVAETAGRICKVEAFKEYPVHTAWDIGRSDYTSIWFWQRLHKRVRCVGYFQNEGEGMPYYANEVKELYKKKNWSREGAIDWVPHDARVTEWGSDKSRIEQMIAKGLNPRIPTEMGLDDGINAVRSIIPICEFDAEGCSEGVKVLKSYRKEWDDNRSCWRDRPRHDWASHGADAFRYLAGAHKELEVKKPKEKEKINTGLPTINDLVKEHQRNKRYVGNRI